MSVYKTYFHSVIDEAKILPDENFSPKKKKVDLFYEEESNSLSNLDFMTKICPDCGEDMVLRFNSHDMSEFWGCSHYPVCRHTERSDDFYDDGWGID